MQRTQRRSDCPIHNALNVLGDRWALLIVRDLLFTERSSYTELLAAPESIATNTLADRLEKLLEAGIVARDAETARYRLTEKGLGLTPLMLELTDWSVRHDESVAVPEDALKAYRRNRTAFVEKVKRQARQRFEI